MAEKVEATKKLCLGKLFRQSFDESHGLSKIFNKSLMLLKKYLVMSKKDSIIIACSCISHSEELTGGQ